MDDIIFIILILIFFVGPLIKKIFGGDQNRRRQGKIYKPQNIPQRNNQTSSSKYRPPSSRPSNKKYNYKDKYAKKKSADEVVLSADKVPEYETYGKSIENISKSFDKSLIKEGKYTKFSDNIYDQIDKNVEKHIGKVQQKPEAVKNNIIAKLMENEKLTAFQRAMVIHEVFNKPKALE